MLVTTKFLRLFKDKPIELSSGRQLGNIDVAYQIYGKLNENADNVILVCHALTGNAHAAGIQEDKSAINPNLYPFLEKYNRMSINKPGWWDPVIGPGKTLDTDKYCVICMNILGSCYGTTGPGSINPLTGKFYGMDFPEVNMKDIVRVQKEALTQLKVKRIHTAIGGSLGGMQVMEWALMYGDMIDNIVLIATASSHSPWAIGFNETQRQAIYNDPSWNNGCYTEQPFDGLSAARQIAMLTYRTYGSFTRKFGRERVSGNKNDHNNFQVQSYLNYQGEKLVKRFDANTYINITRILDQHDVGLHSGSVEEALRTISNKTIVIGISTDILYPPSEQKEIAESIPGAVYEEINSTHGHDAFLIEFDQLDRILKRNLKL